MQPSTVSFRIFKARLDEAMRLFLMSMFLLFLGLASCKKEETVFENNEIPPYSGVPTVLVQNYINRTFIDLIGREPTDLEMEAETVFLEENNLSVEARTQLINKLMTDQTFIEGDSSYYHAYHFKVYEDSKARFVEGASDAELNQRYGIIRNGAVIDSLNGDMQGYEQKMLEANKLLAVVDARIEYREGLIDLLEMYRRMTDNAIYDEINMGSFNFVNATFDDLYYRFPTESEFQVSFEIIENNAPQMLFGQVAANEFEYMQVLLNNSECAEGVVIWATNALLSRNPTSQEAFNFGNTFYTSGDLQIVQRSIMISDEYAGF